MTRLIKKIKQSKEARADASGMTLVEVMFSFVIVGIVLGSLGQGLVLGIRMNTDSKNRVGGLDVAKRLMEKLKSDVQYSQAVFDVAETNGSFNRTFYTDRDGNELSSADVQQSSLSRAATSVANWTASGGATLTAVDANGISHVLVKVLTVKVLVLRSVAALNSNSSAGSPREITLQVEIVRPSS